MTLLFFYLLPVVFYVEYMRNVKERGGETMTYDNREACKMIAIVAVLVAVFSFLLFSTGLGITILALR